MHKILKISQHSVCLGGENGQPCLGRINASATICLYVLQKTNGSSERQHNIITRPWVARWNPEAVKPMGTPALNFGFLLRLHSLCRSTAQPQHEIKLRFTLLNCKSSYSCGGTPSPQAFLQKKHSSSFLETLSSSTSSPIKFSLLAVLYLSTATHVKLELEYFTSVFFLQPWGKTNRAPL